VIGRANPQPQQRVRFAYLVLAASWFWLLLLPTRLPTPTTEPSWETVLNFAAAHHLRHGVELVFTYGPLGYLMQNCFYPGTWLQVALFQAITRAIYVTLVWQMARRSGVAPDSRRIWVLVFAAATLWLPALDADSFYLLFITLVGARFCRPAANTHTSTAQSITDWAGVFLVGLFALVKTTFLAFGLVMVLLAVFGSLWQGRKAPAVAIPVLYVAAFCFGWLVLGHQSPGDLPAWLRGSAEMTRCYQLAMSVWPDPNQMVSSWLTLLLVFAALLLVLRSSRKPLPTVLLTAAGCCLAWKQSFTRGDEYHTRTFFIYVLAAGALVPVLFDYAWNRVAAVLLLGLCLGSSLLYRLPVPAYRAFENARFLVRLPHRQVLWSRQAKTFDLPHIREIIGQSTVDVLGAEQAIAILNGFNYHPAPVFQHYAAATPYLAQLNADFYRSARAPEFLITHGYTIDNRLPNLDDSLSGRIIAQSYQDVLAENGFRLLRRTNAGERELLPVNSSTVTAGEPIRVSSGQWCQIDMQENCMGKLLRLVWMSPPIYARLQWADGRSESYRFVPTLARTGFVVADGAASLTVEQSPAQRRCFRPAISYQLSRFK